jgi:hypothetical protein
MSAKVVYKWTDADGAYGFGLYDVGKTDILVDDAERDDVAIEFSGNDYPTVEQLEQWQADELAANEEWWEQEGRHL